MSGVFSTTRKTTLFGASIPMEMFAFEASSGDILQEANGTFADMKIEEIIDLEKRPGDS